MHKLYVFDRVKMKDSEKINNGNVRTNIIWHEK